MSIFVTNNYCFQLIDSKPSLALRLFMFAPFFSGGSFYLYFKHNIFIFRLSGFLFFQLQYVRSKKLVAMGMIAPLDILQFQFLVIFELLSHLSQYRYLAIAKKSAFYKHKWFFVVKWELRKLEQLTTTVLQQYY
eukprot:TRINITY_DN8540_c0_g3_i4.p3 TRINITY_DN8540_c0_g3~~TRINITY_DN8540_c0_g3_i4.p3  ORF type:complete len:134 (-),score=1.06 TRINITY_DN8540_c0_g3_i4:287-688(-)